MQNTAKHACNIFKPPVSKNEAIRMRMKLEDSQRIQTAGNTKEKIRTTFLNGTQMRVRGQNTH